MFKAIEGFGARSLGSLRYAKIGPLGNNIYIIRGKDNVMIDTGLQSQSYELQKALAGMQLKPEDIRVVLHTHGHADHIGGDILFPDAKKWMSVHDGQMVNAKSDKFTCSSSLGQDFYPQITNFYKKGQVFKFVDFRFEVIETPGHTKGSVCFYDRDMEVLISGDTLFAGSVGRYDLVSSDKGDLLESVKKISGLKYKYLLPGHGAVLDSRQNENIEAALKILGG